MGIIRQLFGTLCTIRKEIPYDTPAEQAKADEFNRELAHLGVRTGRFIDDWGVMLHPERIGAPVRLGSGDLVTVFKTVSKGNIQWEGIVDFDRSDYHHGLQKGLDAKDWAGMFYRKLPARITKTDGTTLFGALDAFSETGTEGVIWSAYEYGKTGYDALYCLRDGDKVTAYNTVYNGDVLWEGRLEFGPEQPQKIEWSEVLRATRHLPTEIWLAMSMARYPVAFSNPNIF